jgi:hypothetical protein
MLQLSKYRQRNTCALIDEQAAAATAARVLQYQQRTWGQGGGREMGIRPGRRLLQASAEIVAVPIARLQHILDSADKYALVRIRDFCVDRFTFRPIQPPWPSRFFYAPCALYPKSMLVAS